MKSFLAVFLAMLIGNPVCCCAFGWTVDEGKRIPAPHSCCSAPVDSSDKGSSDPEPCTCFVKKHKASGEEMKVPQPSEMKHWNSDLVFVADEFMELITVPVAVQAIAKSPPGTLDFPCSGERLARKCSYLL